MQTPKLPKNLPTKNVNLVQIATKCKPTLRCFVFTWRWRQQKKRNGRSMRCVWIVFVVVFFGLQFVGATFLLHYGNFQIAVANAKFVDELFFRMRIF